MDFRIKRKDIQHFRNFIVQIGERLLIERNDDFHNELNEWVNGILTLMKEGRAYFSSTTGFTPFFGAIEDEMVQFETVDGEDFAVDFMEVVSGTIIFMYEQACDDSFIEKDTLLFKEKADQLLAGFRFRFKKVYKGFYEYLKVRRLVLPN